MACLNWSLPTAPTTSLPLTQNVGCEPTLNLLSSAMSAWTWALHAGPSTAALSLLVSSPMPLAISMMLSRPSLDGSRADWYGPNALSQSAVLNSTNLPCLAAAQPALWASVTTC